LRSPHHFLFERLHTRRRDQVRHLSSPHGRYFFRLPQALEREVGLTRQRIAELDEKEARRLLDEARSRPRE